MAALEQIVIRASEQLKWCEHLIKSAYQATWIAASDGCLAPGHDLSPSPHDSSLEVTVSHVCLIFPARGRLRVVYRGAGNESVELSFDLQFMVTMVV